MFHCVKSKEKSTVKLGVTFNMPNLGMLQRLFAVLAFLQLSFVQTFTLGPGDRCPPVQECPSIPAACLAYLNQRQAFLQTRFK